MTCKQPRDVVYTPHSYTQTAKEGCGIYSDVNLTHHAIGQVAMPLVLEAVKSIEIKKGSVFTIVDYGTADGGISMPLIYACIKAIRDKYGEELPINVIYEDQPVNDFKSLFMKAHGLLPGPPTFLQDFPNVFVMASGTSFYQQCFPSNSVDFGLSTTAMHWLRDKPCNITNALHYLLGNVPEEREKFIRQAMEDWELLLLHRSAELKSGGKMVIVIPCLKGHGPEYMNKKRLNVFKSLLDVLKSLSEEGVITPDEIENTNFLLCLRTIDDIKRPFQCKDSLVNQHGLRLVSITTVEIGCRHNQKWLKEKRNPEQFAKEFVASLRTVSYSTLAEGLSNSRSVEEKGTILKEIYSRYEAEVAKNPDQHGTYGEFAYVVFEKKM